MKLAKYNSLKNTKRNAITPQFLVLGNKKLLLHNNSTRIFKIRTGYEQEDVLILDIEKIPNGIYKIENNILTAPCTIIQKNQLK